MQRIYFRRGEKTPVGLSNWFMAAVPNQIIVSSILDIVLAYWKDYDCLVDYYIFHLFLGLALHEFPAIEAKMPRENSFHSIMLGDALARTFCQGQWQDLIDHVSIHKLNYGLNPLPSPRPFQKGKGCNRSCSSLLTASLYGWRGIRALARVLRDRTALQKGVSHCNIWHQRSCYGCFGGDAPAGDEGNEE